MTAPPEQDIRYPIRAVSRLTGIGIDTLRAWERRYGVITPSRDERGRLYSTADVERLRLLSRAVASGHTIGRIALLTDDELRRLSAPAAHRPHQTGVHSAPLGEGTLLDSSALAAALGSFDTAALDHEFSRLAAVLPPLVLVKDVLLPTLRTVGNDWNTGHGSVAREHLMSSTMRSLLGSFLRIYSRGVSPTRLVFATTSGDRHEMGVLSAALLAATSGLAVTYLGPDLPATDIVDTVTRSSARVLVLGLTFTGNAQATSHEVLAIVEGLPAHAELWIGGPASASCTALIGMRGSVLPDFDVYQQQLGRLGGRMS